MGENTPSRTVYDRARAAVRQADPRTFTYELADALLVERDARQAAERRASWWETAAADAAMDRRVLEARVAALEEARDGLSEGCREQFDAVLGVQSTPTEPPGWYCGNVGCRTIGPHEHEGGAGMGADDE